MSDEFFDRFNALNNDEPEKADTESFVADSVESAESVEPIEAAESVGTVETAEPVQPVSAEEVYTEPEPVKPAEPIPPTQPTWQNAYYSAPTQQPVQPNYSNPYAAHYAQPVQQTPPAYAQPRPQNNANAYVDADGYYHRSFTEPRPAVQPAPQPRRVKKEKKPISRGAIAVVLILCVILSGFAGFGGSLIAQSVNKSNSSSSYDSVSSELVIHKVSVENATEDNSKLVDKDTDEITREVADSVVEITTEVVQTSTFYGQYVAQGAGSGVIISDDGYIVTNNHVIEDASNITVTLRSGESYEAELVGADADVDVALIKINATGLTTAIFGDSDTIEVGDKSVIIGNPLGTLGGSVTEGIVSALDRSIVIDGKTMHLMQTDAAINPGNSGGGMFNGQGELIGIVVAKSGSSEIDNIGFVIPINNVLNILGDLKQYGYVRGKADTGMSFVDITNQMYAWYYYGSSSTGVYISSVERGSNAASAGFSAGDRVISVDGKSVSSSSEISSIIAEHSAGDTITFELERSGRTGTLDLTLEEYVPSTKSSSPFNMY
jgi:serine protease Do